jgi:hypothetical protein
VWSIKPHEQIMKEKEDMDNFGSRQVDGAV